MTDFQNLPNVAPEFDLREMLEAGCHFGHDASHWHPKMKQWIYMEKDGIHIFDLQKTAEQLKLAYNYFYDLGQKGKTIVFVGTKRQAREQVALKAKEAGAYWITSRWLGGLLTNWEQVRKSIQRMIDLEEGLKTDKFSKYTKWEQNQFEKEKNRLARFSDGLRGMKNLPDALFIIDPFKERNAVQEAQMVGIPMVGLLDSNANPVAIDIVIPANDDGRGSIDFIVNALSEAYAKGRAAISAKPNKAN
jgi:small subunit ribosomal protein S2